MKRAILALILPFVAVCGLLCAITGCEGCALFIPEGSATFYSQPSEAPQ